MFFKHSLMSIHIWIWF